MKQLFSGLLNIIIILLSIIWFVLLFFFINLISFIWFKFLSLVYSLFEFIFDHDILGWILLIFMFYPYFLVSKIIGFCIAAVFFPNLIKKIPDKANNNFPSFLKSKTGWFSFFIAQSYIFCLIYFCRLFSKNTSLASDHRVGFVIALIILFSLPFIGILRITKN